MKKLLIAGSTAIAIAASVLSVPAAAEVYADPAPGIGVQVGPFAAGVGPGYGWHDPYWRNGHYAYGYSDCRVIRERTMTPSGRVIIEYRRICD